MMNNKITLDGNWGSVNVDDIYTIVPNNKLGEVTVANYTDINNLERVVKEINNRIPKIKFNCKLRPTIDRRSDTLKVPVPFTINDEVCFLSIDKKVMREACAWAFDADDQLEDPQLDSRIYYEHLGVYC